MLSTYSRLAISALAVLGSLVFSVAQAEGDAERGAVLADTCKGCHAVDSYTNVYPTYHVPRIGGQSADYLAAALQLYRDGDRPHKTMQAQAASYTDEEIADIAAYLASVVPPITATEVKGQAPASATACQACHGANGVGQIAIYPYLAGQHEDYLLHALREYKDGLRKGANATIMQTQVMNLTDADLRELAAFYAKQDGLSAVPMR